MKKKILITSTFAYLLSVCTLISCDQEKDGFETQTHISVQSDLVYAYKNGMALTLDVYRPINRNQAAVIFINSGGFISPNMSRQCASGDDAIWNASPEKKRFLTANEFSTDALLRQFSFERLLQAGYTVFDVRHGSSPLYPLNEIAIDCLKAIEYIKTNLEYFDLMENKLGVWGASAGGYLAGLIATLPADQTVLSYEKASGKDHRVTASVLYYPAGYDFVTDIKQMPTLQEMLPALQIDDNMLESISLKNFISSDDGPMLIMYGDKDMPFIVNPSENIYADLDGLGGIVEKNIFQNIGHTWCDQSGVYDMAIGEQAMSHLVNWFDKYLLNK